MRLARFAAIDSEAVAAVERVIRNSRDAVGDYELFKASAVCEAVGAEGCDGFGNSEFPERRAAAERLLPYLCETAAESDALERCAVLERSEAELSDVIGDCDGFSARTAVERVRSDIGQVSRVFERHRRNLGIAEKSVVVDRDDVRVKELFGNNNVLFAVVVLVDDRLVVFVNGKREAVERDDGIDRQSGY